MRLLLLPLLAATALPAPAQTAAPPAADQVVQPEVARREIRVPQYPSKDISVGLFAGSYATQNFGTSAVVGVRLGYEVTEDFFVEAALARTRVSDELYRRLQGVGGVFANPKETMSYYNLSAGWNLLPGEVFIGTRRAKPTQFFLVAGVGSTDFVEQKKSTFNVGFGWRVFLADRFALRVDLRDHVYSLDLLGKSENTQNLELSAGLNYFF